MLGGPDYFRYTDEGWKVMPVTPQVDDDLPTFWNPGDLLFVCMYLKDDLYYVESVYDQGAVSVGHPSLKGASAHLTELASRLTES